MIAQVESLLEIMYEAWNSGLLPASLTSKCFGLLKDKVLTDHFVQIFKLMVELLGGFCFRDGIRSLDLRYLEEGRAAGLPKVIIGTESFKGLRDVLKMALNQYYENKEVTPIFKVLSISSTVWSKSGQNMSALLKTLPIFSDAELWETLLLKRIKFPSLDL